MKLLLVAGTVLLVAACQSGGDVAAPVPSGPPVSELRIGMQEYRLQLSAGTLQPGTVTITATNAGSTGHDVRLVQDGQTIGATEVLSPGGRDVLTVQVAPGVPVDLDCTVGGHAEAGMHTSIAVAGG